jgi:hypothetical protein
VLEDDVELTPEFAAAYSMACRVLKADSFIRFPFRERESGRVVLTTETTRIIEPVPVALAWWRNLSDRRPRSDCCLQPKFSTARSIPQHR